MANSRFYIVFLNVQFITLTAPFSAIIIIIEFTLICLRLAIEILYPVTLKETAIY